jgi:ferredoxin
MMKLETIHHQCLGESCLVCETWLYGFQTEYDGKILVSDTFMLEMDNVISSAIENCPNNCIVLSSAG